MANTRVKLNDNTTIPLLAFGTGTALFGKDAETMVTAAINAGFTHFDGAQVYRNEESLGAGITRKLNKPAGGETLQLGYVDLFLVHTPLEPGRLKAVWKEMEALKKEGIARSVGVSNFRTPQLREILDGAEFPPSVNQHGGVFVRRVTSHRVLKTDSPSPIGNTHATLGIKATYLRKMMFMRTILALSLAAFALAIPVASPHADGVLGDVDPGDLGGDLFDRGVSNGSG
ncbi:NADP-dependent oxidoreductase domain-containing protein [Lactarius pseudohatsudake]|nr:NADP-dependent oxidoreductase domain-containing protein [Lactarius pseudohatsudake]